MSRKKIFKEKLITGNYNHGSRVLNMVTHNLVQNSLKQNPTADLITISRETCELIVQVDNERLFHPIVCRQQLETPQKSNQRSP